MQGGPGWEGPQVGHLRKDQARNWPDLSTMAKLKKMKEESPKALG